MLTTKIKPMQQIFKTSEPLRWVGAVLLTSVLFLACNSKETKTVETKETKTVIEEVKKDSLPPLNTDTDNSTRPETIKNK